MARRKYRPVCVDGNDVYIPLNDERTKFTVVDLEDWEMLCAKGFTVWCYNGGYAKSSFEGTDKKVRLHQLIAGKHCDHADRDGLNNRRSNLRPADLSQQGQNQRRRSDSTYGKGVWKADVKTNPFRASIFIRGKAKHLGCFATAQEARDAYDAAALEIFGEYAFTNKMADEQQGRVHEEGIRCDCDREKAV